MQSGFSSRRTTGDQERSGFLFRCRQGCLLPFPSLVASAAAGGWGSLVPFVRFVDRFRIGMSSDGARSVSTSSPRIKFTGPLPQWLSSAALRSHRPVFERVLRHGGGVLAGVIVFFQLHPRCVGCISSILAEPEVCVWELVGATPVLSKGCSTTRFGGRRWLMVLELFGGAATRELQHRGPRCVEYFSGRRPTSTCASSLVMPSVQRLITQLGCYGTFLDLDKLEDYVSPLRRTFRQ